MQVAMLWEVAAVWVHGSVLARGAQVGSKQLAVLLMGSG